MRLRQLIVFEDGDAAGTVSADIATVAYPLFVKGRNRKEKRANARRAVGQKPDNLASMIGRGVYESFNAPYPMSWEHNEGETHDALIKLPDGTNLSVMFSVDYGDLGEPEWQVEFWRNNSQDVTGEGDAQRIFATVLEAIKQFIKIEKPQSIRFSASKETNDGNRNASRSNLYTRLVKRYAHSWGYDVEVSDYSGTVGYELNRMYESTNEAHVLGNDSVIYRLDRDNPMSDTEVLVIGGAGRYSLEALRNKARREADQLAQDLKIEHGGAFRRSAENIKQLTNTLNTIVAAYNELKRIRSKGGRGSRGITDEDANFIRECMGLVQRALKEGVAVEPDAHGYEKSKLTSPQYAVVVDTPSDYDWYKIGNHWNDRKLDPHEFGQEDSDTILVGYGERDFKNMLAKLDQMGFTYKLIGGTHSQPEIHKDDKR